MRSSKKLARPKAGEPSMDIDRLAIYRDDPSSEENIRYAKELLLRCGPLVLDGVQYSVDTDEDKIRVIATEFLAMDRARLATGIEKMRVESV